MRPPQLLVRSRLRHTRRLDDAAVPAPLLSPSDAPSPQLLAFARSLQLAPDLGAQVEAVGELKGALSRGALPSGPQLQAALNYVVAIAGSNGCGPLLRPLLLLLLAALGGCGDAPEAPVEAVTQLLRCCIAGAAADGSCEEDDMHRAFVWVALLEDKSLREKLLLRAVAGWAGWHDAPLCLAARNMGTAMEGLSKLQWGDGAPPSALMAQCDAATAALKLFGLTLSILGGVEELAVCGGGDRVGVGAVRATLLEGMAAHCRTLLQWDSVPREVATSAAVAICSAWVWAAGFGGGCGGGGGGTLNGKQVLTQSISALSCSAGSSNSSNVADHWLLSLSPVSRLALVRGVLITAPSPALLLQTGTAPPPLFCLAEGVLHACCATDTLLRLYGFQVAETWLSAVRRCSSSSSSSSPLAALQAPHLIIQLLDALLANWDSPSRRLTVLVGDVFEGLCETLSALPRPLPPSLSGDSLLNRVLRLPLGSAAWCAALQRLLARTGDLAPSPLAILCDCPALLPDLMRAAATMVENGSARASTITALLMGARRDLEGAAGIAPPLLSASGKKDKATAAAGNYHSYSADESRAVAEISAAHPQFSPLLNPPVILAVTRTGAELVLAVDAGLEGALRCLAAPLPAGSLPLLHAACLRAAVHAQWMAMWLPSALQLLLCVERDVRIRAVAYVVRDAVLTYAGNGVALCAALRQRAADAGEGEVGDDGSSISERADAAVCAVAKLLRAQGLPALEGDAAFPDCAPLVTISELHGWGCGSSDPEFRILALELLVTCKGTAQPPLRKELELAAAWLCLNTSLPQQELRKRALRAFSLLFSRTTNAAHAWEKHGERASRLGAAARARLPPPPPQPDVIALESFLTSLATTCIGCLYPGAPAERIAFPLALLNSAVGAVCSSSSGPAAAALALPPSPPPPPATLPFLTTALLAPLRTPQVFSMLLNLMGDPQERTRGGAASLLRLLSTGDCCGEGENLPGFSSPRALSALLQWALRLAASPRDRESAQGAAVLHAVFSVCVIGGSWQVRLAPVPEAVLRSSARGEETACCAAANFIHDLNAILAGRVRAFAAALRSEGGAGVCVAAQGAEAEAPMHGEVEVGEVCPPPLAHGICDALKQCLMEAFSAASAGRLGPSACLSVFTPLLPRSLSLLHALQKIALNVVAGSGEEDGGVDDDDEGGGGGESLCAGRVDCAPGGALKQQTAAPQLSSGALLAGPVSNSVGELVPGASASRRWGGGGGAMGCLLLAWTSTHLRGRLAVAMPLRGLPIRQARVAAAAALLLMIVVMHCPAAVHTRL